MELKTLFVDFEAQLSIDMNDVEVLRLLSQTSYPVAKWITETYHVHDGVDRKKIENTLRKMNLVLVDILERRKAMLEVKTTSK